jgi:D-sedoheptulose 7-phosphate isomerase
MAENNEISELFDQSIAIISDCKNLSEVIDKIKVRIVEAIKNDNKVILFGNGGSAADAQHMAAELIGRFLLTRKSIPAISLTTDTSVLTAVGNDFGFENVFSRQCESIVCKGDIIIAISTSGNSPNVINGVHTAKERGGIIIGLTGMSGGKLSNLTDEIIKVPTTHTPEIQESHRIIIHILCNLVEKSLVNDLI